MSDGEASLLPIEDYDAIEEAVKETARGRWFLAEYARRNRQADTLAIVATIERLEKSIRRDRQAPDIDRIRLDLADMAEAISRTRQEIAQIQHESEEGGRFQRASNELDAIVSQTETATNEILLNAEKIQELAWTLREHNVPEDLCDGLDACATDIYTGCSFQDLTGQRTRKVVTVLGYLESRINTMIGIWQPGDLDTMGLGAAVHEPKVEPAPDFGIPDPADTRPDAYLLRGPAREGEGISQTAIDDLLHDDTLADDLDMVGADEPAATEEPPVFAEATADIFALPETPATVSAADFAEADVFLPAADPEPPRRIVQRVGNTLVAVEEEPDSDAAPALAIVPQDDPIARMSIARKLVTFG